MVIKDILVGIMAVVMLTGGIAVLAIYVIDIHILPPQLLLVSVLMMSIGAMLTHYFINRGVTT